MTRSKALDFVDWESWLERHNPSRLLAFESEEAKQEAYDDYCDSVNQEAYSD